MKKDFKKREFKANSKRIEKDDSNAHQGLQIVRAETPEKYKKINYGSKGGAEGGLNRRQKQKVSDLIKKLRVSFILSVIIALFYRSTTTSCLSKSVR